MATKLFKRSLFVLLVLSLLIAGCSAAAPEPTATTMATATATLEPTHTLTPTATLVPTQTPRPTSTPDMAATQKYDNMQMWLEKLAADRSIPSLEGKYHALDDFTEEFAKIGYYNWSRYQSVKPANFMLQAKVKISNETTENAFKSGCGFVFADQFSNHALFFALDGNANYRTDGGDRGSKYIDPTLYQSPDGVLLTVVLSNKALLFYVNDQKAISQTVYGGPFSVGPAILSGTSEGFGTRCEFTDVVLWEIQ